MVRIEWTIPAKLDLEEIHEYISPKSKKYARLELDKITSSVKSLVNFPELGKIVSAKYSPPLRQTIAGNFKILSQYMVREETIWVARIIHGSPDTNLDNLVFEPETDYHTNGLTPEEEAKVEEALASIKEGKLIPHEEIKRKVEEWLKHLPKEE